MGFSNPAQPIDYDLIATLVEDIAIDYVQVRDACDQALSSTDGAIAAVLSAVGAKQPAPAVPSWSATRNTNLAAFAVIQLAIDAVTAQRQATPDLSAQATATLDDLTARRAALWALVKTP